MSLYTSVGAQLLAYAKEYGYRRVLAFVSRLAYFFLPIVLWWDIYLLSGQYFLIPWHPLNLIVPGIGILFFLFCAVSFLYMEKLYLGLVKTPMSRIQEIPPNKRALVVATPLRFEVLSLLSYLNTPLKRTLISAVFNMLMSYSFTVLLATRGWWLLQEFGGLLGVTLPTSFDISVQELAIPTVVLFLLSLYCLPEKNPVAAVNFSKRHGKVPRWLVIDIFVLFLSVVSSLSEAVKGIVKFCSKISAHINGTDFLLTPPYFPFLASLSVPQIASKAFKNVYGGDCVVAEYKYEASLGDFDVKSEIPKEYSAYVQNADPARAVALLNQMQIVVYIGLYEEKCFILGIKFSSSRQRLHGALLYFDNSFIRQEFEAIMEKEIEKARDISLPK